MKTTLPVVLIQGDGIGPEITASAAQVLDATGLPFQWIPAVVGEKALAAGDAVVPPETLDAIRDAGQP